MPPSFLRTRARRAVPVGPLAVVLATLLLAPLSTAAFGQDDGEVDGEPGAQAPPAAEELDAEPAADHAAAPADDEAARARVAARVAAALGKVRPDPAGNRMFGWRPGDPLDLEVLEPFAPGTPRRAIPWYERIRVHGEVASIARYRLTEAGNSNDIPDYGIDRIEWQIRLQLGLTATFDPFELGALIGTGPTGRQAEATIGTNFAPDNVVLRQAWGHLRLFEDMLGFTIGRHPFPTRYSFRSILSFDPDVALTGMHLRGTIFESIQHGRVSTGLYVNAFGFIAGEFPTGPESYGYAGTATLIVERLWLTAGFWGMRRAPAIATNLGATDTELYALEAAIQGDLAFLRAFAHLVWNFGAAGNNVGILVGTTFGERQYAGDIGAEASWYYSQADSWVSDWTDPDAGNLFGGGIVGSTGVRAAFVAVIVDGFSIRLQGTLAWTIDDQLPGRDDNDLFGSMIAELSFRF